MLLILEWAGADTAGWNVAHAVASSSLFFAAGALLTREGVLARFANLATGWLLAIAVSGYVLVAILLLFYNHPAGPSPLLRAMLGITASMALAISMSRTTFYGFTRLWGLMSLEIYVAHVIAAAAVRLALQRVFGIQIPLVHLALGVAVGMYGPIALAYCARRTGWNFLFTLSRSRVRPWTEGALPALLLRLGRGGA